MKNLYVCTLLFFCLGPFLFPAQALAVVIDLNFVSAATGVDNGPQDGIFDSLTTGPGGNFGALDNNGFISFRTAFEFDLSGIPASSTVNSATLTTRFETFVVGSPRFIAVHGYAGDGTVQLGDFALDGLVGSVSIGEGTPTLAFDATSFISGLLNNGNTFGGFNVREDPANPSNFGVMHLDMTSFTRLSMDFTTPTPVPEPSSLLLLVSGLVGLGGVARRRQGRM